jgi:hypothetical protein
VEIVSRQNLDQSFTRENFQVRGSATPDFVTSEVLATQGTPPFPHMGTWNGTVTNTNAFRYIRVAKTDGGYFAFAEARVFGTPATAGPLPVALNVTSSTGTGLNVAVSPNDLDGAGNGATAFSRRYNSGTSVTLTAPATSGAANFVKWQINGADLTTNSTATFTLNSASTLNAVYATTPPPVAGTFVNGSFESDESGWTNTGTRGVISAVSPYTARQGTKLMVFNGGGGGNDGVVSQSFATVVGQTYAIDFDMGVVGTSSQQQRLQIAVAGSSQLFSQVETMNGGGASTTRWLPKSFSFVANSTTTTVTFSDVSTITNSVDMTLDNVRLVTSNVRDVIFNTTNSTPVAIGVSPADRNGLSGGSTTFTRSYNVGTVLTISAPATNFVHWERNGTQFSTSATTSYTVNGNEYVTAVYTGAGPGGGGGGDTGNTRTLTINSTPAAGSAVTVTPADNAGQTNGSTTFTRTYPTNTVVSLVAPHQNFVKWLRNGVWYATNPSITVTADQSYNMTVVYTETPVLGPFTNGSFEDEFRGWTWAGTQQSVKVKDGLPTTAGLNCIEFNSANSANGGSVTQTFTTAPGTVYTVAFDQGVLSFGSGTQVLRARVDNSSGTALYNQTFSLRGNTTGVPVWAGRTFTFTANSNTSSITFLDASTAVSATDLLLDNVRITPPGPGTTITTHSLTVGSSGASAVPVTVSPADTASLGNGVTLFTRTYNSGTAVTLTAPASFGGGAFTKWTRNGVDFTTNTAATVTMDAAYTLTAVYAAAPPPVVGAFVNGSFENDETGWTNTGTRGVISAVSPYTARQGSKLMIFNGGGGPNDGVVSQSFATVVGQTYAIDFDMGVVGTSSVQQRLQISATGSTSLLSQVETMNGGGASTTRWLPKSFSFVADSTTTTVAFTDVSTTSTNVDMTLDNVRIVTGTTRELIFNTTNSSPVSVAVSPADLNGAGNGTTQFTRSYAVGTVLTISAAPEGFIHWERNGTQFSTNATTSLTVNGNEYITAVTTGTGVPVVPQTLTVSSSPVASVPITVTPADTLAQTDGTTQFTRTYNTGAVVTLTAPASSGGMNFTKWQRNGVDFVTTNAATVTMDASYTLTAIYAPTGGGFVNGSFENALSGWTTAGTANTVRVQTTGPTTDGTAVAAFNSENTINDGVLSQTFNTTPGVTYTVRFDQGVYSFNTQYQSIQVSAVGTGSLLSKTYTLRGTSNGNTVWAARTDTFVANSATTTLTFRDTSTTSNAIDLLLDNVRVTSPDSPPPPTTRTLTVTSTPATGVSITVSPADTASLGNGVTQFTRTYNSGTAVVLTAPASFNGGAFTKWTRNGADFTTNTAATVTMDAAYTLTAVYAAAPPPVAGALVNGSFENDETGWTNTGTRGVISAVSPYTARQGSKLMIFNGGGGPNDGVVSQSFATTVGQTYAVDFDMGVVGTSSQQQRLQIAVAGSSQLFSQSRDHERRRCQHHPLVAQELLVRGQQHHLHGHLHRCFHHHRQCGPDSRQCPHRHRQRS